MSEPKQQLTLQFPMSHWVGLLEEAHLLAQPLALCETVDELRGLLATMSDDDCCEMIRRAKQIETDLRVIGSSTVTVIGRGRT